MKYSSCNNQAIYINTSMRQKVFTTPNMNHPLSAPTPTEPPSPSPKPLFPLTRWSIVAEACHHDDPESAVALEELCRNYWVPLYVAVRRFGHSPEDAEDLTQGFFAKLLEKNWLHAVDRKKQVLRQHHSRYRQVLLPGPNCSVAQLSHRQK